MKNWNTYTISQLADIIKYLNEDLIINPSDLANRLRQIAFKIDCKSKMGN